ncbi:MAG: chorismate synthase [Anaerolineales bacterium]|nr:chorismate synthase [Anaerolineales bacterium]
MIEYRTAGESHGPAVVALLEGIPAGLPLSAEDLVPDLARRQKGYGVGPRMKAIERDRAQILSGVLAGQTTGAPIAIVIWNRDHENWMGQSVEPMTIPRPGHADLTAATKYGYPDLRFGLERASARETAGRTAMGAVCRALLKRFGIRVGSYVTAIGQAEADLSEIDPVDRLDRSEENEVRCPDDAAAEEMRAEIRAAMEAKDTLGGVFEVLALGVPPGLGSHVQWYTRLESRLAQALMSVQAIKGVEIGGGFASARKRGTQVHDAIVPDGERVGRRSNRAGGIEGGITTGEPLVVRAAMKPISTTLTPQDSVDLATTEATETQYERSDFCAVPRAAVVGEAMVLLVLADTLLEKLGGDTLGELEARFARMRKGRFEEYELRGEPIVFWPRDDGKAAPND